MYRFKRLMSRTALALVLVSVPSCANFTLFSDLKRQTCWDWIAVEYDNSTICVSPDYYTVDDVRTPMGMTQAERILPQHQAFLPTADMVDAIWQQADIRLEPITMTPGPEMTSTDYYVAHDQMIDRQIEQLGINISGLLIAGHKKDIVQPQRNGRVTIYGWHRSNGDPIQPVSSVHGSEYYDYSHGLRLIRMPW
jgi:hypothetical protein